MRDNYILFLVYFLTPLRLPSCCRWQPSLSPCLPPGRSWRLRCRSPPLGGRRRPQCAGAAEAPRCSRRSHGADRSRRQRARLGRERERGRGRGPCPPPPAPPPAPPPPPGCRPGAGWARALPPPRHPRVPHPSHRASHLSHRTVVAPLKRSPALRGGPFIWGSFMTLCKCAKFLIRLARQPRAALAPRSLHAALCFTAQQAALLLWRQCRLCLRCHVVASASRTLRLRGRDGAPGSVEPE